MGTIKNAVYKVDNGVDFDEIHFKTKAEQVICSNGKTAEAQLGEIVQSGSNANGSYVKFADGTMICRKNGVTFSKASNYYLTAGLIFAATFVNTDITVAITSNDDSSTPIGRFATVGITTTGMSIWYQNISAPFTGTSYSLKASLIAIGRWK